MTTTTTVPIIPIVRQRGSSQYGSSFVMDNGSSNTRVAVPKLIPWEWIFWFSLFSSQIQFNLAPLDYHYIIVATLWHRIQINLFKNIELKLSITGQPVPATLVTNSAKWWASVVLSDCLNPSIGVTGDLPIATNKRIKLLVGEIIFNRKNSKTRSYTSNFQTKKARRSILGFQIWEVRMSSALSLHL